MNTLYTIGYQRWAPESLKQTCDALCATLLDIRYSPRSQRPEWAGDALAQLLGATTYRHEQALGNRNYKSGTIELATPEQALPRVTSALMNGPVVLLCVCADVEICHRKVAAEWLAERLPTRIIHLPAPASAPGAARCTAGSCQRLCEAKPDPWPHLGHKNIRHERILGMLAKIVLTLEQDEERGTNEAMEETVTILATLDVMPIEKLVLTLECEEAVAERYRAILRTALRERPIGIVAKFKTTTEEEVNRYVLPLTTPMDQLLRDGGGIDSITMSGGGRSATITAKQARSHVLATIRPDTSPLGAGDENLFDEDESDNDVTPAADDLFVNDDEQLEDRDGNRRPMTATERQAWETR